MINLITKQTAEQLRQSRKRDVYNFRDAIVDSLNGETGTLIAYNLDTYEFVFKIGNEEVSVGASYFRTRRVLGAEISEEELLKLSPKNAPDYIKLEGVLTGIDYKTYSTYSVGEFKAACNDIAMANAMEGKTLHFNIKTLPNTLIWGKNRYWAMDSYLVIVTEQK